MNVDVKPGNYVVAVSGGVDSVVLLDYLMKNSLSISLTVAHFDHGIRPDSADDAMFVENLAKHYGLPYVSERVELGPQASEALARQKRYDFLHRLCEQTGARAIITAHHQDDVLETAIINMRRGTGRLGLTSLKNNETVLRPMLDVPKSAILAYAKQHQLQWREDSTNTDERYTRNYIRHQLLPRFSASDRQQLLDIISRQASINAEIDALLDEMLTPALDRRWFAGLPHDVSCEVMAGWLRRQGLADFDRRSIERLVIGVKTKAVGKRLDVLRGQQIIVGREDLQLSQ